MENREQTLEGRLLLWLSDWLTVLLLSAGVILPCLAAAEISGWTGFDMGAVLVFCVFGALGASALLTWRHGVWAALALAAGDGLILWRLWKHVTEDWLLGRPPGLIDLINKHPGTLYLLYALAVLILAWVVVRTRQWWMAAALVLVPLLPAIQRGVLPSWGAMLAGFAGWGSMLLTGLFDRRDPGSLGRARLLSLGGMTALVGILVMSLPMEGYLRPQWATDARENMIRGVNRQLERFFTPEELENNILTQLGLDLSGAGGGSGSGSGQGSGDGAADAFGGSTGQRENLLYAGPRRYLGRRVMTVRTDQPDPAGRIYLRGVSFDTYTGTSWEHSDVLADFAETGRFPALTAPEAAEYTMYIRNTASNNLLYYPYRFTGSGEMDEPGRITGLDDGQGNLLPMEDIIAQRQDEYSVTYRPGGPEDGFTPLTKPWVEEEARYRTDVAHAHRYLDVPYEVRQWLERLLNGEHRDSWAMVIQSLEQELEEAEGAEREALEESLERMRELADSARTLEDFDGASDLPAGMEDWRDAISAASRTASWLASIASYDPNTPAMDPEEDFVMHFLEEGRGFCVHFATAGTLLLRMQGIPAR